MRGGSPLVLLLVLGAVLTAGCFGERSSPVDVTPYLPVHETGAGRAAVVPFFLNSTFTFKQDLGLRVGELPAGWTFRLPVNEVVLPGRHGRFVAVEVTPDPAATPGETAVEFFVGDTRASVRVNVTAEAPAARAGVGANLSWVHWDRNGTLLGWHEPLLSHGLKAGPNASAREAPVLAWLGNETETGVPAEWATAGYVRLVPDVERRVLALRVGESLLVETNSGPDPFNPGGGTDGARLLVRLVEVRESP